MKNKDLNFRVGDVIRYKHYIENSLRFKTGEIIEIKDNSIIVFLEDFKENIEINKSNITEIVIKNELLTAVLIIWDGTEPFYHNVIITNIKLLQKNTSKKDLLRKIKNYDNEYCKKAFSIEKMAISDMTFDILDKDGYIIFNCFLYTEDKIKEL